MSAKTIGQNVRTFRQARGWTQQELGERATVCKWTVFRVEAGKQANRNTVARIAMALGLRVRDLQTAIEGSESAESAQRGATAAA